MDVVQVVGAINNLKTKFYQGVEQGEDIKTLEKLAFQADKLADKVNDLAWEMDDDDNAILLADCYDIVDRFHEIKWNQTPHKTHTVRMETSPLCRL